MLQKEKKRIHKPQTAMTLQVYSKYPIPDRQQWKGPCEGQLGDMKMH